MQTVSVLGGVLAGIQGRVVTAEISMRGGLPGLEVIGLAGRTVQEAAHRVRSALAAVGLRLPPRKIVISLIPADLPKRGASLDLPLAVGLLRSIGQMGHVDERWLAATGFWGGVGLDGAVRPCPGVLPFAVCAREQGLQRVVVAPEDAPLANLGGLAVYVADSLASLVRQGPRLWQQSTACGADRGQSAVLAPPTAASSGSEAAYLAIAGLEGPRRAVHLAAAGGHSCCFLGPPGVGKSMLAKSLHALLGPAGGDELVEIVSIAAAARYSSRDQCPDLGQLAGRPLREPMTGLAMGAMVGTGRPFCTGELTRAHGGVLLLDELSGHRSEVLRAICLAMDRHWIEVHAEAGPVRLPAAFQLAATSNLCACGRLGGPSGGCVCTQAARRAFWRRLSGSLLDRIDMHVEVAGPELFELEQLLNRHDTPSCPAGRDDRCPAEGLGADRASVAAARAVQTARYGVGACNATAADGPLLEHAAMSRDATRLLAHAHQELGLSARGYFAVVRVARTIADVAGHVAISGDDLAEALSYRCRGVPGAA